MSILNTGNVFSLLSTIILVFMFLKYRKELKNTYKKLSTLQLLGVVLSYLITILIAFILIYYVGNWFVSYITINFLKHAVQVIIIILVISTCLNGLNRVLKKISKGIL